MREYNTKYADYMYNHVSVDDITHRFRFQIPIWHQRWILPKEWLLPALKSYIIVVMVDNLLNGMPKK